jgi:hypothetical protein
MSDEMDPRCSELVHAKYLGGTAQVMPSLADHPRCCQDGNQREAFDAEGREIRPNPRVVVEHGDVILLDRFSAEERVDFEVVEAPKPKAPKSPKSTGAQGKARSKPADKAATPKE